VVNLDFIIVAANEAYSNSTLTDLAEIRGQYIFEVFPDNPALLDADGVQNLSASFGFVADLRTPHHMPIQRYDIRGPDKSFVERHWRPANYPVLDDRGRVAYILHHIEDVTKTVLGRAPLSCDGHEIDYVEKAKFCAKQAGLCRSREGQRASRDLEQQYMDLEFFRKSRLTFR
jgi:hypothetical protein